MDVCAYVWAHYGLSEYSSAYSWDPGRIAGRVDRVEEAFNVD